jgi:hypothetical protein
MEPPPDRGRQHPMDPRPVAEVNINRQGSRLALRDVR